MDDQERFDALLEDAARLPFDQQVPILESALAIADATLGESQQVRARMALCEASQFGGRSDRAPELLRWLLARLDAGRLDEEDALGVLWMNKWLVGSLLERPEVPLSEATEAVAAMAERFAREGQPPGPALKSVFTLRREVAGHAAAEDAYAAWVEEPRSELSDCEACEPTTMADHLVALGRHAQAVAAAERVLSGELACAEEPEDAISVLLPSLVAVGRADDAAELHAYSWRAVRDRAGGAAIAGRLIGFCARTGNLGRGLELLRARVADRDASSPQDAMLFTAQAVRLADALAAAGHADLAVTDEVSVADVAVRWREDALALAARFDARNGTSAVGDEVARILAAPDLGPVDLGAPGRHPLSGPTVPERSSLAGSPDLSAVDLTDPAALVAAIEQADQWGGEAELLALTAAWDAIRADRLAELETSTDSWRMGAAAELELRSFLASRGSASDERLANARALYARAELTGEALLVEQRIAVAAGDGERVRALVDEVDRIGTLDEVMRAQLVALHNAEDREDAAALAEALTSPLHPTDSWRTRSVMAYALAQRTVGDPTLALASVDRGLALLQPDELPDERGLLLIARAGLLEEMGRSDEAAATLVEAGQLAWDAGSPTLWSQALAYRGRFAALRDEDAEAEALLAEAAVAAAAARQVVAAGQLTRQQAHLLSALGRPVQAAEFAERAVALLPPGEERADAASTAAEYAVDIGDVRRARELASQSAREHANLGPSPAAFAALGELGHLQWRQDDDEDALATFDAALGLARTLEDAYATTYGHWWRSNALTTLSRFDEAVEALDAAEASLDRFETSAMIDPDLRGVLDEQAFGEEEFARFRRTLRSSRTRTLASAGRFSEALDALGDPEDWSEDPDHAEIAHLAELLRADAADQERG